MSAAAGSVASRNLCPRFLPNAIQRLVESICTAPEPLAFFLRHVRLEHLDHAAAADDARQGQRDAKLLLIAADRNDRAFVIEHYLGDTGRYDADSVLASIMAFDDGDVRIAHLSLQLMLQLANPLAAPLEQCRHWNSADPCRGPQEHLRGSVVANHLCFDMRGIRAEVLAEVNAKSLAVEICTCAQHHRPGARLARDIGERIGWIGHDEKYRVGLRPHDPWHDIAIDFGVLVQQFEAALWVVAIRSAAGFFVHARSDQHDARALEGVIITVDDVDLGTERCAVAHVGRYRLGGLAGAIDEDDLARTAAGDGGHCARAANIAGSNNSNSHRLLHCWLVNPAVIGAFRTGWPASSWLYPKKRHLAVKFRLFSPTFALHAGQTSRSLPCNAGRFEQEPGTPLGLVDPVLDQAGAGHVVVLVANRVGLAQARRQLLVVVAQLCEHVEGGDEVRVVVQHALQAADVADRAQRGAADLADAFGDGVGGRENLLALLVEEEMIVAEVGAGHMPMEILGLQVKRKHVGEQDIERAGDLRHGVGPQVGRRFERSDPQRGGILCFRHLYLLLTDDGALTAPPSRGNRTYAGAEKKSDRCG